MYIYDAQNLKAVVVVEAHTTPVSAVAFSDSGHMLATSSVKGTVIRIFAMPNAELLHQFQRGYTTAQVASISFDVESTLIAVSSADKSTVHLFRLRKGPAAGGDGGGEEDGGGVEGGGEGAVRAHARHSPCQPAHACRSRGRRGHRT